MKRMTTKIKEDKYIHLKRMTLLINPAYHEIMSTLLILPMDSNRLYTCLTGEKSNRRKPPHIGFRLTKLRQLGLIDGEIETIIKPNVDTGEKGLAGRVYHVNRDVLDDTIAWYRDIIAELEV
jgi:hypothetical protein